MTKKTKKKTVHWTKLPRAKLVSMVKRLERANAELKTQLAEARETRLLYTAALAEASGVALQSMEEAALAEAFGVVHVKQETAPAKMPWE